MARPLHGERTMLLRLEFCKRPQKLDNSATQTGSNRRLWNTQLQLLTNLKFVALSLDIGPFCRRRLRCYTAFIRFASLFQAPNRRARECRYCHPLCAGIATSGEPDLRGF